MIIASALGRLFDGLEIVYNEANVGINYGYGDQKELLAWITSQDKANVRKYPLVWYVLNDYTEFDGWYKSDVRLVIMQNTDSTWFNPKRKEESYTKILEPTWSSLKNSLTDSSYVEVFGGLEDRFKLKSEPKYAFSEIDKSEVSDVVDALVVEFKIRIKPSCI